MGRGWALRWAVALAALLAAAPAAAQESRLARIAYVSDGDLYTIAADGSDRRLVAREASTPDWSPDGRSIAFTREGREDEGSAIWVAAADGSGARAVSTPPGEGGFDAWPTWSPDGGQIAFVRVTTNVGDTIVSRVISVPSAGGDARTITRFTSAGFFAFIDADWSPDGARILVTQAPFFDESESSGSHIRVVDVATGARHLLVRDAAYAGWSPAGDRIAYVRVPRTCEEYPCSDLYVANADGSARRRITKLADRGGMYTPSWSADGQRIAFASDRNYPNGSLELYSIRPDGSCLTWLTNGTATSYAPAWEPGASLSTDPGGCGAIPREPLIETDLSEVSGFEGEAWWLGPRFGDLLLSFAELESGEADFSYNDCGRFEPSECPPAVELTNSDVCSEFVLPGGGALTRHGGALLHAPSLADEADGPSLYLGAAKLDIGLARDDQLESVLSALRRLGADAPPAGGLPRAELPNRFWRTLERTRAAVRKYGRAGAARRLRVSRARIDRRLALDRRLRQLGPFGRLDCPR